MDNKSINKEIRKVSNFSSLPIAVFIILIEIVAILYPMAIQGLASIGLNIPTDVQYLIIYSIQYLVVAAAAIGIFYLTRKKSTGLSLKNCFCKPAMSFGWTAKWIIISVAFAYLSNFISLFISFIIETIFGVTTKPLDLNFGDSGLATFALVLTVAVYAPIFEELLFRGTVYRNSELMGQKFAMFATGIAFGLWHMNFVQVVYASVIGVFACFIYAKTRSIIPSMILHFIINGISAVITVCFGSMGDIANLETYEETMKFFMENPVPMIIIELIGMAILGLFITGIVLFIIEMVKHRKMLTLRKSVFNVSAIKRFAVYFTAPVTLLTYGFMIFMTIWSLVG